MTKKSTTTPSGAKAHEIPVLREWKTMFILSEHWKSDLAFFQDEVAFFSLLLDKYLLTLIDNNHIDHTRHLVTGLTEFEKKRLALGEQVNKHLLSLRNLVQDPFAQDSQVVRNQHEQLEAAIADFTKNFRTLKKEVFSLAESAMTSEKAKHLLES